MTDDQQISHGIDLETLEQFAVDAADRPGSVQLGLGASATYEGTAAHSLAKIDGFERDGETVSRETREYTIPYGGWKEVLDAAGWVGATDRMEPIEGALSALAASLTAGVTLNAAANGVDIDYLETRARTDFDPAVLFRLEELKEAHSVFENLTADVEVDGEELDRDAIDDWARRAPVYTLISMPQDVRITINTPSEVAED